MAKRIVWTSRASDQLIATLEFYNQRNGNKRYSQSILKDVDSLLKIVSKNAFVGRLTEDKLTRVFPIRDYLIYYRVKEMEIQIVSFWDNRQNPEKLNIQ